MSGILSRRSLLAGAGYAAAGTLAARLVSAAEVCSSGMKTAIEDAKKYKTILQQFAELRVQAIG